MSSLTVLLGVVLALPATTESAPPGPDVLELIPAMVSEIESQAEEFALIDGPILLDEESFIRRLGPFHPEPITAEMIAKALDRPYHDVVDPVECSPAEAEPEESTCGVRDRGLHLRLDSIGRTEDGYRVRITFRYTDLRGEDRVVPCSRTEEYSIERKDGAWHMGIRVPISEFC